MNQHSRLEGLPGELRIAILCLVPDVPSLIALVQASPTYRHTFNGDQSTVLTAVLANQIPTDIMPDAVANWQASKYQPCSAEDMVEFCTRFNDEGKTVSSLPGPGEPQLTPSDALAISNTYRHVQFFAVDFCSSILSTHPVSGESQEYYTPPSQQEMGRIQRTFYRYQLYHTLFRGGEPQESTVQERRIKHTRQQEIFFDKFSTLENEQLACIHDYLYRRVSLAFEDTAEYNRWWADVFLDVKSDRPSFTGGKEHYISFSLAFLHQLVLADTFNARSDLLMPSDVINGCFLDAVPQYYRMEILVNGMSDEDYRQAIKAHRNDADTGPIEAWWWANNFQTLAPRDIEYAFSTADLREWGYCMWDLARHGVWGTLDKPWNGKHVAGKWRLRVKEALILLRDRVNS